MLEMLLFILLALIGLLLMIYFLFPQKIFQFMRQQLRQRGGWSRKSLLVDGRNWPYLEGGDLSKPTLILIHGFSGEKDNWSLLAKELKHDFHIIAPDLPGFGENDRSSDIGFDNLNQTRRFKNFVDALGVQRPHLAGNSMGGWIALRYAMEYPDQIGSLILIDSAGVSGAQESELQHLAADERYNPLLLQDLDDSDRFLAFVAHNPPRIPARLKAAFHADALQYRDQLDEIFWIIAREMQEGTLNHRLGEVQSPTLILWGRQDRVLNVSSAAALEEGIKGSRSIIFENIGHVPMVEAPKPTAEAIREFIQGLKK